MSVKTLYRENIVPKTLSSGEEQILKTLYASHYKTLVRAAIRILYDREASHDVVMDLLFHVAEKHQDLCSKSFLLPYLVKATINRAINRFRKQQKERMQLLPVLNDQYPGYSSLPSSDLYTSDLKKIIRQAMLKLPRKTRIIFYLHRRYNMTYRDVSVLKKISVRSVEQHISLALKCLRQVVRQQF